MIHYGTYRGAVVGLRGAVVGVRGAAVGVRGAAVGNIGIPTYVISRGAVVRQPIHYIAPRGDWLGSKLGGRINHPHKLIGLSVLCMADCGRTVGS